MRFLAPRDTLSQLGPFDWLRTEMDRLFDSAAPFQSASWAPPLTLHETEGAYDVRLPIAGADPEKIDIEVEGGVLRISGRREGIPADAERRFAVERFAGEFQRALRLPAEVDASAVAAHYRDGILHVRLPKAEEARPRRIPVQA